MEVKPGDLNIWFGRYYSGSIDFTSYLILTIIFIILSIIFKYKYEEEAFWKIYLSSSVFWIIFELILQGTGWRTWYEPPTLFWSIKIKYPITALLQGPMEGGIPTVLMYGFAKLLAFKRDKQFIILTIVFVILVSTETPWVFLDGADELQSQTVRPGDGEVQNTNIALFKLFKYGNAQLLDLIPVIIHVRDHQAEPAHRLIQ